MYFVATPIAVVELLYHRMEGIDSVEILFLFGVCAVDAGLVETSLSPEQSVVRDGVVSGDFLVTFRVAAHFDCFILP